MAENGPGFLAGRDRYRGRRTQSRRRVRIEARRAVGSWRRGSASEKIRTAAGQNILPGVSLMFGSEMGVDLTIV